MADTAELEARLATAETAYHNLMMGMSVAELRDENGEMVRYTPANAGRLAAYIYSLKSQLGLTSGKSTPARVIY